MSSMEASHFRKGNIVANEALDIFKKGYVEMEARWIYEIAVKESGQSHNPYVDNFKPIPLTEEWLLRLGFEKHQNGYYFRYWGKNGLEIIRNHSGYNKFAYELGKGRDKILDYVHQLQNLTFILTGEELTLKQE